MALSETVRRVVTTVDKDDKAVVLFDGASPHKKVRPTTKTASHLMWVTDETPADVSGNKDRAAIEIGIMPPRGGSVCRVVDFPPRPGRESFLGVVVAVHGQGQLLQVVRALGAVGRFANLLHGGQQQPDQHRDDGNHHEQLDQREGRSTFGEHDRLLKRNKDPNSICAP